jgi:hypothetical protein
VNSKLATFLTTNGVNAVDNTLASKVIIAVSPGLTVANVALVAVFAVSATTPTGVAVPLATVVPVTSSSSSILSCNCVFDDSSYFCEFTI